MSYKPSSGVLPMVTVDPTAPIMLPEYAGRWAFLSALQLEAPSFWRELHQLREDTAGVEQWMTHTHVADEWLADIVWSTLEHWRQQQINQLVPGNRW